MDWYQYGVNLKVTLSVKTGNANVVFQVVHFTVSSKFPSFVDRDSFSYKGSQKLKPNVNQKIFVVNTQAYDFFSGPAYLPLQVAVLLCALSLSLSLSLWI
jgi:hypothetical protein